MKKAVSVTITGKVQGVFFRAETRRAAMGLGLNGYVKNMANGSVRARFQGDDTRIQKMLGWCQKGSPHSRVDGVTSEPVPFENELTGFEIRY